MSGSPPRSWPRPRRRRLRCRGRVDGPGAGRDAQRRGAHVGRALQPVLRGSAAGRPSGRSRGRRRRTAVPSPGCATIARQPVAAGIRAVAQDDARGLGGEPRAERQLGAGGREPGAAGRAGQPRAGDRERDAAPVRLEHQPARELVLDPREHRGVAAAAQRDRGDLGAVEHVADLDAVGGDADLREVVDGVVAQRVRGGAAGSSRQSTPRERSGARRLIAAPPVPRRGERMDRQPAAERGLQPALALGPFGRRRARRARRGAARAGRASPARARDAPSAGRPAGGRRGSAPSRARRRSGRWVRSPTPGGPARRPAGRCRGGLEDGELGVDVDAGVALDRLLRAHEVEGAPAPPRCGRRRARPRRGRSHTRAAASARRAAASGRGRRSAGRWPRRAAACRRRRRVPGTAASAIRNARPAAASRPRRSSSSPSSAFVSAAKDRAEPAAATARVMAAHGAVEVAVQLAQVGDPRVAAEVGLAADHLLRACARRRRSGRARPARRRAPRTGR